jgi:hypothetical protein
MLYLTDNPTLKDTVQLMDVAAYWIPVPGLTAAGRADLSLARETP